MCKKMLQGLFGAQEQVVESGDPSKVQKGSVKSQEQIATGPNIAPDDEQTRRRRNTGVAGLGL